MEINLESRAEGILANITISAEEFVRLQETGRWTGGTDGSQDVVAFLERHKDQHASPKLNRVVVVVAQEWPSSAHGDS